MFTTTTESASTNPLDLVLILNYLAVRCVLIVQYSNKGHEKFHLQLTQAAERLGYLLSIG